MLRINSRISFLIATLAEEFMPSKYAYCPCEVYVFCRESTVDSMVLETLDLDVILDMDWLNL